MTEYSNIAYQHKIELLTDTNQQLTHQIAMLKQANQALHQGLAEMDILRQEKNSLMLEVKQLSDLLEVQKKRSEDMQNRRYLDVKSLKEDINEKNNYIERLKIEHEKQLFRMNDELRQTKLKVRRQDNLQEMSRSIAMSSSVLDPRLYEENSMEKSNRFSTYYPPQERIERIDRSVNKSTLQSRLTSEMSKEMPKDYAKYSKEQLKMMVKNLSRRDKKLRQDRLEELQRSKLAERSSIYRHSQQ